MKVFHAARQDVEIFLELFGSVPTPLFDTQVAAMVAGFGDQVGYDGLVAALTGAQIDKAHRFSDWSARPLSPAQVTYAAADVTHLHTAYSRLRERLEREGRTDWVEEEMRVLCRPETYRADPDTMWERLRPRTGNRRMLGVSCVPLRRGGSGKPSGSTFRGNACCATRACWKSPRPPQSPPRRWPVAAASPAGFAEGRSGTGLLTAIAAAVALPEDELPEAPRGRDGPRPSPALVSLLKVLLAAKCEQHDVAPKLVASSEDVDRLAVDDCARHPRSVRLAPGIVFGDDALALKRGEVALGVAGKRIKLIAATAV